MSDRTWWKLGVLAAFVPIVVVAQPSTATAATINVVAGDAGSLRAAVSSAVSGDIVSIPAGNYELPCPGGEENNNASGDLDIINKSITLRGPASGTATIRPAPGCGERVIDIIDFSAPPETVTIERLTIRGGRPSGSGGGINVPFSQPTMLTIRDSVITDNRAGDAGPGDAPSGGGVFLHGSGSLVIERTTISDNSVGIGNNGTLGWKAGGGGVAVRAINNPTPGSTTIVDSVVSGNTGGVAAFGGGGGLWLDSTEVTLTNVDVIDNQIGGAPNGGAAGLGGGVAINPQVVNGSFVPLVLDVAITGGSFDGNSIGTPVGGANVAGGDGGGLYVLAAGGSLEITDTEFADNHAGAGVGAFGGGRGGSVYASGSSTAFVDPLAITLDGVTVDDSTAGSGDDGGGGAGGGAYLSSSTFNAGGVIVVRDSAFTGNSAGAGGDSSPGGFGGALVAQSNTDNAAGSITIENTTFDENSTGAGGDGVSGDEGGSGGAANLFVTGSGGPADLITVTGSTFRDNSAAQGGAGSAGSGGTGGSGGALVLSAARVAIDDSTFLRNEAGAGGAGQNGNRGGRGGAVSLVADDATVTGSTFRTNRSGDGGAGTGGGSGSEAGRGGALFVSTDDASDISTSEFTSNSTGDGGDGAGGAGPGGFGGAVYVDQNGAGTVDVTDVTFGSNATGDGGSSSGGGASAGGFGGGLAVRGANDENISISLNRAVFTGNSAGHAGTGVTATSAFGGRGGGAWLVAPSATASLGVLDSVFADNATGNGGNATGNGNGAWPGGAGGGIYADIGDSAAANGDNATITVTSSSITGNSTGTGGVAGPGAPGNGRGGEGAGMWLSGGVGNGGLVSIANTTVADNEAGVGGGDPDQGVGDGGGILFHATNLAELDFTTITGNFGNNGDNVVTTADNTKFRASVVGEPGRSRNGVNCRVVAPATVTSVGYNVETNGDTCGLDQPTDIVGLDEAVLGPLQDNGGVGLSRVPKITGSDPLPVLDRVPAPCGNTLDQLGTTRPLGGGCDVGAVEADLAPIDAIDDVLRVDGGTTVLDVLGNDDLAGFTKGDIVLTVVEKSSADQIEVANGSLTFRSRASTGEITTFTYRACLGTSEQYCDTATVTLIPAVLSRFVALPPLRLFETRPGEPGAGPKGFVAAGTSIDVQITGVAGVPVNGVSAVAMNLTATGAEGPGFVTAHPTGTQRPLASNLNLSAPGDTIPNFVIVPVGAGGKVTLFAQTGTHLLADVAGYFTESGISQNASNPGSDDGRLFPLTPTRIFDTRPGERPPGPKGFVGAGRTIDVQVAGEGGVPASGVSAVVMNLTATASDGPGFVSVFPSNVARPTASNLNLTGPRQTTPNLVIVPLGPDGKISLYSHGGTHLLGDVTGYFTDGSAPRSLSGLFAPATPSRVFDTRPDEKPPGSKGFVGAGEERAVRFTANTSVPANGVGAVMINATATAAAGPGFVTAWPDGERQPLASTLNLFFTGQTRPNAAALPIGDGNRIRFFSSGGTHLLADVSGWFLE